MNRQNREDFCSMCGTSGVDKNFYTLQQLPSRVPCCASCMSNFGHRTVTDIMAWKTYMSPQPYPWGPNGKTFSFCRK